MIPVRGTIGHKYSNTRGFPDQAGETAGFFFRLSKPTPHPDSKFRKIRQGALVARPAGRYRHIGNGQVFRFCGAAEDAQPLAEASSTLRQHYRDMPLTIAARSEEQSQTGSAP